MVVSLAVNPPQLFAEDVRYILPIYQRKYSWDEETASQFLGQLLTRVRAGYEELTLSAEGADDVGGGGPPPLTPEVIRSWTLAQDPISIGFIVLYHVGSEDGLYGVVDGQQRMITLSFIFAALRECFSVSDDAADGARATEMHDRIHQREHVSRGLSARARLTVRKQDADLFERLCLVPGGMRALLKDVADGRLVPASDSRRMMVEAQLTILHTLQDEEPDVLRLLASYILECHYGVMLADNQQTAHQLFSSLNFKSSVQLEPLDRFRSALIIADEAQLMDAAAAAKRAWAPTVGGEGGVVATSTPTQSSLEPVWDDLEHHRGRDFLSAAVLCQIQSRLGLIEGDLGPRIDAAHPALSDKYEKEAELLLATSSAGAAAFLDVDFARLLMLFGVVDRAALPAGARNSRISDLLSSLKGCGQLPWAPVVYTFLRNRLDADGVPLAECVAETEVFLAALDRYVFFLLVTQTQAYAVMRLHRILVSVRDGMDVGHLMVLGTEDLEGLRTKLGLPGLARKRNGIALTVLLRAEAATRMAPAGASAARRAAAAVPAPASSLSSLSVEHVLPAKVGPNSAWARLIPDKDVRADVCHSLGNLTLLGGGANSAASNRDFAIKKETYQRLEGAGLTALTAEVMAEKHWDEATIRRRHHRLVELLLTPYVEALQAAGGGGGAKSGGAKPGRRKSAGLRGLTSPLC